MAQIPWADRIGGAPISWGVCEAPGWGHELPPDRVLPEMAALGLRATELGPTGYLGADPAAVRATLERHGLSLIGGFLPVPLHLDRGLDLTEATEAMRTLRAAGGEVVVLAARSADGSYDHRVRLTGAEWEVLAHNLARLREVAAAIGLRCTLHPHVGTAVEDAASVERLIELCDIPLCVDTGHLLIGGTDPLELVRRHGDRVGHVHLKDVDTSVADRVAAASVSYQDAVRQGLYTPLGAGDLDIPAIVRALEAGGYRGWYVLEQDTALDATPADGAGPIGDVRASIAHLASIAATVTP
jgi:inosose dehydratase